MDDWISDLLIFSAGVTGGILVSMITATLRAGRADRNGLASARSRILEGVKEQHDQEILHAAVRTAEDLRGELHKSALTLQKALLAASTAPLPVSESDDDHPAAPRPAGAG